MRSHFSVVMPPFFAADASAADRARVHHGTMHPKLWLLLWFAVPLVFLDLPNKCVKQCFTDQQDTNSNALMVLGYRSAAGCLADDRRGSRGAAPSPG